MQRVHLIAAARPNFMKVAPLWHALSRSRAFEPVLIHTGQHYDPAMSDSILADLKVPAPRHHLGIGSGPHGEQTGRVMIAYEQVAMAERPDWLVVVGDVNSTLACALVGAKLRIPTVHLEAGLRSGDRAMPEEINRVATDAVADVLWTPSPDGDANLAAEGVPADRITRVGNIMLDSFEMTRGRIDAAPSPESFGVGPRYGLVTLHRPSNVDSPERLRRLVDALAEIQADLPLLFPVHPRTAARLEAAGLDRQLDRAGVRRIAPVPYIQFMRFLTGAAAAITDSGGVQEETTYLGISCLTLRENTERPITIEQGTNRLVTPDSLPGALAAALAAESRPCRPEYWDGRAAERCVADLLRRSGAEPAADAA
ncbi:UDP-N-acetylglucosamine 2-epimerase (non-hydrolyzing) [Sphingosinicella sp. YJ22]|uniref:non-hydrolyzing UDP-N-acetylglucosamine 2-epimerase n=1 Tax=Sphingosinicella sp. YJ22 TaxID=1104780 RepID=UPI001FAF8766|nr:UDP-N-acetylglucosamine 2-epimerase (non-hydrolyzing) [Sphingosinicella sp. YJ22]